jgi:hypothetical protein
MFATGSARPVGLATSAEPPTSPETIGRAPSNFDPPVPLVSLEELVGLGGKAATETPAPAVPAPLPAATPEAEAQPASEAEPRRVVLRLVGGEELDVGAYGSQDDALARAQELISLIDGAESAGEWPEVEGRLLRPGAIVSLDVLVGA